MTRGRRLLLNCVLDGREGKLTDAKWAALAKCSADTARRDINDLLARGVLRKMEGGVRGMGWVVAKGRLHLRGSTRSVSKSASASVRF